MYATRMQSISSMARAHDSHRRSSASANRMRKRLSSLGCSSVSDTRRVAATGAGPPLSCEASP
jgi:hypothetical protein